MVHGQSPQTRSETWRFIYDGARDGALNMALDMAMTQSVAADQYPPTLRLYTWNPSAISLGYHQSEDDISLDRCRDHGIDVVWRPTGGRAILHAAELTYAVALPPTSAYYHADISSVYELLSRCLVRGLKQVRGEVDFKRAEKTPKALSRGELSSLCYATSIRYEIAVAGKKLVGSAQRHINGGVLQHGSILIDKDHLRIVEFMSAKNEMWRERVQRYMEQNTISLNQLSGHPVRLDALVAAVKAGFENELNIHFVDTILSDDEYKTARSLLKKFSIVKTVRK